MPLIKAKQIDLLTVASGLTSTFNDTANVTLRNNFVNSIKAAPGFDEKVRADASDDSPANYLSQKLIGSTVNGVTIDVDYDSAAKKVKITGEIDTDEIANEVASKFTTIFFEATEEINSYTDIGLTNKTVLYVIREHSFLYPGLNGDDYQYDASTGTITFNSTVFPGERISLLII